MLTGRGVHPKLEIKPNFLVCRLNVSPGNAVVNTPIELLNGCEANVNVVFEKVLELEGEMRDPVVSDHKIQQDKHKKDSSSADTKTSKSKKAKKKGKNKEFEKFSSNLNEKEIYSLNNYFQRKRGPSYFKILNEDHIEVPASSKLSVKICFGMVNVTEDTEESTATMLSGTSKKKEKKGAKKKKNKIIDHKYYVAKYNILLGGCNFVKDMIVIGHFAAK